MYARIKICTLIVFLYVRLRYDTRMVLIVEITAAYYYYYYYYYYSLKYNLLTYINSIQIKMQSTLYIEYMRSCISRIP